MHSKPFHKLFSVELVFEEHVDNNILKSMVIDALLRFNAKYCMNKLCKLLFIVVLFALMYATVVVFAVTLLIIMWRLFRAYILLIMFSSSLSLFLWLVHVNVLRLMHICMSTFGGSVHPH